MITFRLRTLMRVMVSLALLIAACAWPRTAAAQAEIVEYYGYDAIGNVRIVFDSVGTVVGRGDYLPFGEEAASSNGLPAERFTGQVRDPEAGFDYFKARSYQPRTGRFGRVDPVFTNPFKPQTWNRYSYVLQNPLSLTDPSGLTPNDCVSGDTAYCTKNGPLSPLEDSGDFNLWAWHWAFLGWPGSGDGGAGGRGDAVGRNTSGTGGLASLPWGRKKREVSAESPAAESGAVPPAVQPPPPAHPGNTPPKSTTEQNARRNPSFQQCYTQWQFSSLFADTPVHGLVEFFELGSEVSVLSDVMAARAKLERRGALGTRNPYASGLNRAFKTVSTGAARGFLTKNVGNPLTPGLAFTFAFTGAYNATIAVQCVTGTLY